MTFNLHPPRNADRRNLLAVYVGAFFASLGFSFVTPLLPLLLLHLLEGDVATVAQWVGVALGVAPLLTAATSPWWGSVADRYGQKKMLQRALIAIGISIALMGAIDHPWQVVALRAAIGGLGGISVACLAAVTASSSKQTLGRNIGMLQGVQTLGLVVGPLVGGGVSVAAGLRPTFVTAASLFALALALVTWLYRDVTTAPVVNPEARTEAGSARRSAHLSGSALFWVTLAVLFSANFVDGSFMVMLPLYLPALGAPIESVALWAGLGLSGGALTAAIASTLGGRLTGRWPALTLILAMLPITAAVLVAVVFTGSWWQLIALRIALGMAAGAVPTLAYTAAADLVPPSRRGAVVGIASSAGLIGWAVAPALVGFLAAVSAQAVFVVDLALILACALAVAWSGGTFAWRGLSRETAPRLAEARR